MNIHSNIIILIYLCFVHLNNAESLNDSQKRSSSGCNLQQIETCSLKLTIIGDESSKFATTKNQLEKRCRDLKSLQNCVKTNAQRCFDTNARRYISILLFSITKANRGYCRSKKLKSFLEFNKCANQNIKSLNSHMQTMIKDFHGIKHLNRDDKLTIPLLCCNYQKFKTNFVNVFHEKCPDSSVEAQNLLNGYVGDLLNAGCGDYTDESDLCDSVLAKTPKWTGPLETRDIILSLVGVINKISDFDLKNATNSK